MAVTKSNGLLGLSHYRSSRVSTSLAEPIYQNLFCVQLVPPMGLSDRSDETVNIILEGVTSVGTISASKGSQPVTQSYKFSNRSFSSGVPESTVIDLQLNFQLNLMYDETTNTPTNTTYKFLREWVDLIYDPLTGKQGLKRQYVAPSCTITMFDRACTPFWQWQFYNIFPTTGAPAPTLDYLQGNLMSGQMTFRADFWDEVML